MRRLVPAAVLVVAGVLLLAPWFGDAGQRRGLPADAFSALVYAANWHFARSGVSYAALFDAPSLLLHFWSLGVEGQFYLVFPLVMVVAARRGGWHAMGLAASTLGLASALATAWLAHRPDAFDRVYYGTDTRSLELLVGAVAALLAVRLAPRAPGRVRTGVALAGTVALVVQVLAWTTTTMWTPWVARGGLGTYAVGSALVVLAAVEPGGPVRRLLAWGPLRRLGEISYGAYLLHWPIVLWLTPERTGLSPAATHALRAALTIVLAEASYRWLERPVRVSRWWPGRRVFAAAALASIAVVAASRAVPVPAPEPLFAELDASSERANAARDAPAGPDAIRYAVFGDSTAAPTARAFETWAASDAQGARFAFVAGRVRLGCGLMGPAERRDVTVPTGKSCPDVVPEWAARVRAGDVGLAIVQTGAWETREHVFAPGGALQRPGDPEFDAHLRRQMERAMDALTAAGATVVWMVVPHLGPGKQLGNGKLRLPAELRDPARIDRYNALLREVAAARADRVALVDLPSVLATLPGGVLDVEARPDGMHLTTAAADALAGKVGPAIAAAYDSVRGSR